LLSLSSFSVKTATTRHERDLVANLASISLSLSLSLFVWESLCLCLSPSSTTAPDNDRNPETCNSKRFFRRRLLVFVLLLSPRATARSLAALRVHSERREREREKLTSVVPLAIIERALVCCR
jgi:hypothetical protein